MGRDIVLDMSNVIAEWLIHPEGDLRDERIVEHIDHRHILVFQGNIRVTIALRQTWSLTKIR